MSMFKSNIARRITGVFLVITTVLVALVSASHFITIRILEHQTRQYYDNVVSLISRQVEAKLSGLEAMAITLGNDSNIIVANQSNDSISTLWKYADVLERAKYYTLNHDIPNITGIYLLNKQRLLSSTGRFDTVEADNDPSIYRDENRLQTWFYRSVHTVSGCIGCEDPTHFTDYLSFFYTNTPRQAGGVYIGIDVAKSDLLRFIDDVNLSGQGIVFFVNEEGVPLFSSGDGPANFNAIFSDIRQQGAAAGQMVVKGESGALNVIFHASGQQYVGAIFSQDEVTGPISTLWALLIACIVLALFLTAVFLVTSNRQLFRPFHTLVDAMRSVGDGNLSVRIADKAPGEMGLVYAQFNEMTKRMDFLINQVYLQDIQNKRSELKFLQSQINPHFLFNCLNFIYQMSMSNNNTAAADMSLYLGQYFRYAITRHSDLIPLGDEIDNIKTYLDICLMQYPRQMAYDIHLPDAWREIAIPKLSVQPVVENAFIHGLKDRTEKGHIWIDGIEDVFYRCLQVHNNGGRLTPQEVKRINALICDEGNEAGGYGLNNTHRRLRLYFGPLAGLELCYNDEIQETVIKIRIPKGGASGA